MCIPGYAFNNQAICTMCPSSSQPSTDQTTCVCITNTQYFNQTTFSCSQCPPNSHADQTNCICNQGYTFFNGSCVPTPVCQAHQILSGDNCTCIPGYAFNYYGICTMCPSGSQPSPNQTKCICSSITQIFNPISFICT
jgi:hypothetical protein